MYSPTTSASSEDSLSSQFSFEAREPELPSSKRLERSVASNHEDDRPKRSSPNAFDSIASIGSDSTATFEPALRFKELEEKGLLLGIGPDQYMKIIELTQDAIRHGVYPERISTGSSGSYFVKSRYGRILGVFKPKDEEPYSQMNPKWTKWIHRVCCPCCFGRSCVMAGAGYISEAAASVVDRFLGLDLVPRTEIVLLGAPTFSYSVWERWDAYRQSQKNPLDGPYTLYRAKVGSFQVFVEDFKEAHEVLEEIENMPVIGKDVRAAFQDEFEKLVILDYAIRNTDRSLDNLLVRLDWVEDDGQEGDEPRFRPLKPVVKMAAIDNGLSFPYKHPDNWRSYPFGWSNLPNCSIPFSKKLSRRMLKLLGDRDNWDLLVEQLREVFRLDINFRERHFQRQMSVLRGQLRNIVDVLEQGKTPMDLINMPSVLVQEQVDYLRDSRRSTRVFPPTKLITGQFDDEDSTEGHPRWMQKVKDKPIFTLF